MLVPLACPLCGGVFRVDAAHAGTQVLCPHCAQAVMIPRKLAAFTSLETAAPSSPDSQHATHPEASPYDPPVPTRDAGNATHGYPAPPPLPGASAAPAPPPAPPGGGSVVGAGPVGPPGAFAPPKPEDASAGLPADAVESLPRLACAACETLFRVPPDAAGRQVRCPSCDAICDVPPLLVDVPEAGPAETVVAPEFQFEEEELSADEGDEQDGIRHLSRDERSEIRSRRNLLMFALGIVLLIAATLVLRHFDDYFRGWFGTIGP